MDLEDVLNVLARHWTDEAVIATMSSCVYWPSRSASDRDLAYYAPMGSASAVGLGLALARPDIRAIVLDGDGSVLMNLGSLVTIGAWQPPQPAARGHGQRCLRRHRRAADTDVGNGPPR